MTSDSKADVIGFLGLGQMGSRMARRLTEAGNHVCAYDPDRHALDVAVGHGASRMSSVAQVAQESDVLLLSLPTPAVVKEVVSGPGGLVETAGFECLIDHSTSGLDVAREVAEDLAAIGVEVIDAPVSGGIRGAEMGTLAIMAAAPTGVFSRRKRILETVGKRIFHVGETPGQGQVMKLVNNLISAAAMVATAEGMVLGAKAGLAPKVMLEVLNASTARNSHTEDKFPRYVLPRTFDFGFSIGLLHKDVRLGLEMAETLGVPMPVTGSAHQMWNVALAEGGPQADMTTIVRQLERWTGVEIA